MNPEQLDKGQKLLKDINRYKTYLAYWQNAEDYYSNCISIKWNSSINRITGSTPIAIPFKELKARSIIYFQDKLNELEREFENL